MRLLNLWQLSIALSAISLLIMAALIVARLVSERRTAGIAARKSQVLPRLLAGNIEESGLIADNKADGQTTDLLIDLMAMVRGNEREEFVGLASRVGATDVLIRRLKSGSARVKVAAAEALTSFSDDRVTNCLDTALEDRSADVRLSAALALANSGRAPPISVLIDRLSLGSSENSLLITTILQRLVTDRPMEVEALLDNPSTPATIKAAAIDALSASGRFDVAPKVNQLALQVDADDDNLARYLRALGTLQHPAGIPAITRSLKASAWWVRAAAAEAAGRIGVKEMLPQLTGLLDDPDWWVRFRAGEALSRLGVEGISALRRISTSAPEPGRSAARLTLAEQGIAVDA